MGKVLSIQAIGDRKGSHTTFTITNVGGGVAGGVGETQSLSQRPRSFGSRVGFPQHIVSKSQEHSKQIVVVWSIA